MKVFCFTVDDNIRFLKDLSENDYQSMFENPYLNLYRRLHEEYGMKVQLNLFYQKGDFNLSQMTNRYRAEWAAHSNWLKLSFHARIEDISASYQSSDYREMFADCQRVQKEILRFASHASLAQTTTIHYCVATEGGLLALQENGVRGLLGLYGSDMKPRFSYQNTAEEGSALRRGSVITKDGLTYAGIDIVLNSHSMEDILSQLRRLSDRDFIKVMIHEQYFYPDYPRYQPEFGEKLSAVFDFLVKNGFESIFFEAQLPQ